MSSNSVNHWDGHEWQYSEIHREKTDQKAILVCGGPSLKLVDVTKLKGPGKYVLALNNTYPYVMPDAWMGMDDLRCYPRKLVHEPFPKFYRSGYHNLEIQGFALKEAFNSFFINCKKGKREDIFDRVSPESNKFLWEKNTLSLAVQLLMAKGFKEIYFVGCDLNISREEDYYDIEVSLSQRERSNNKVLYKSLTKWLKWLVPECKKRGIKLYSSSPKSPINKFMTYVSIDEINKEVESMFLREGPLWHSITLDHIKEEDYNAWDNLR